MAIRITHTLTLGISEDLNEPQKQFLYNREAGLQKTTIDAYTAEASGNFSVTDGTQLTLSMGNIALPAKGCYIEVNAECSIRFSGSPNPHIMRIPPGGTKAKLFIEADVTSIVIDASESVDATGSYAVWGTLV